jgi:hypothetical protein
VADAHASQETVLRVLAADVHAAQRVAELVLEAHAKRWRVKQVILGQGGEAIGLEYAVRLKKRRTPGAICREIEEYGKPNVERTEIV